MASFVKDFAMGASWATTIDIGHRYSGTVAGFMNMIGNLGTVFAAPIAQWIALSASVDGKTENWMIEAGPPGALVRRGWSKQSIPPGIEILVEGYQAKDGTHKANGRDVTLPDGKRLFVGSSGTGAPLDGRDPTETGK